MTQTGVDEVTLVDTSDRVIGRADKVAAHRHPAQLHRAISVWLARRQPDGQLEVLLQQRSASKIVGAGWWGNGVCGNVRPGESYEACAQRRLREELGLALVPPLQPVFKFHYQAYGNAEFGEHELDQVFTARVTDHAQWQLNPNEVQAVQWVGVEELAAAVAAAQQTTEFPVMSAVASVSDSLDTSALVHQATALTLTLSSGQEVIVAPWTVMMVELGVLEAVRTGLRDLN